jgi:hypothetical protein
LQEYFRPGGYLRSKKTNSLQVAVLFAGVVFIILGLAFFYSPLNVFKLAGIKVTDTWYELTKDNELISPMYHLLRAFSGILVAAGLTMVMPLFDPLKYRLLIYFNGVVFPFLASLMLVKTGISLGFRMNEGKQIFQWNYIHRSMIIIGLIFGLIFLSCLITLFITRKDAKDGKE